MTDLIGARRGDFEILREIGRGGMGVAPSVLIRMNKDPDWPRAIPTK